MEITLSTYAKKLADNLVMRYPSGRGRAKRASSQVRKDFEVIFEWHFYAKLSNMIKSGCYKKKGKNLIIYSYHTKPEKTLPYFREIFRQLPKAYNGQHYAFKNDVFLRFKILEISPNDVKLEVITEGVDVD